MNFRLFKTKLDKIENWDSIIAETSQMFDRAVEAWKIDDSLKRSVIITMRQQAQVGEGVLDLLSLEESQTAVDPIG